MKTLVCLSALSALMIIDAIAADIHDAVRRRDTGTVRLLLERDPSLANSVLPGGITPLHIAATLDSATMVELLVTSGADINATTDSGATPLHWAAMMNSASSARTLLKAGADPDARSVDGLTPLKVARQKGSAAVLAVLEQASDGIAVSPAPGPARVPRVVAKAQSSSGSVATDAGATITEARAALKADDYQRAYDLFLELVKADPGNEEYNFGLGVSAFGLGKYSHASLAFERDLSINPQNDYARFELARTHIASGQPEIGRALLKEIQGRYPDGRLREATDKALADLGGIPAAQRNVVCQVEVGGFYDDNANVGPLSDVIAISPLDTGTTEINTLTVDEDSKPISSMGFYSSAAVAGRYDVGTDGGWELLYSGLIYGSFFQEHSGDLDTQYASLTAGMGHSSPGASAGLSVKGEYIGRGGESLVTIYGIVPSVVWSTLPDGQWQFSVSGLAEFRDYKELDDRDGPYYSAGGSAGRYLDEKRWLLFTGLNVFLEDAAAEVYRNVGGEAFLGAQYRMPEWRSTAYVRVAGQASDYADKEELAPEKRRDSQFKASVGVTKFIGARWQVGAGYRATANSSSFDLYDYRRNMALLNVNCSF